MPHLARRRALRLTTYGPTVATTLWDPDVYSLGVYETREAAFLTSAPVSSLYQLSKKGLLHPRHDGITTWSFSDLVAVRTLAIPQGAEFEASVEQCGTGARSIRRRSGCGSSRCYVRWTGIGGSRRGLG